MKTKEELINKYLHNELDEKETVLFNNLLKTDPDFANEVELKTIFFADRSSDLKIELEQKLKERTTSSTPTKARTFSLVYRVAAVFIIGLVGVLAFYFFNATQNNTYIVDDYIKQKHDAPSIMMDNSTQEINWQKAIDAYRKSDYKQAIVKINSSIENNNPTSEHLFYLGLANLYNNPPNYEEAIKNLKQNLEKGNKYYQEVLWYSSLCYLKQENTFEAKKQLLEIVKNNYWKKKEAQALLKQLTK